MMRMRIMLGGLLLTAVAVTGGCAATAGARAQAPCAPGELADYCYPMAGLPAPTGLQIVDNGPADGTPFMVTDPGGIPMWYVNQFGAYFGGDGLPPSGGGGQIGVADGLNTVAVSLNADGTITMQAQDAATERGMGPVVVLTPRMVLYLAAWMRLHPLRLPASGPATVPLHRP
jgi:hypothetical protein